MVVTHLVGGCNTLVPGHLVSLGKLLRDGTCSCILYGVYLPTGTSVGLNGVRLGGAHAQWSRRCGSRDRSSFEVALQVTCMRGFITFCSVRQLADSLHFGGKCRISLRQLGISF